MRNHLVSLVVCASALLVGCASADPGAESVEGSTSSAEKGPAPVREPRLVSMTMQFNSTTGDWLMSRTAGEGAPAYHYNGVEYKVFDTPPSDAPAEPLYRCHDQFGTHYQSNDFNCEGVGTEESLLGYTYVDDPGNGALPIMRCIGATGVPIVSTMHEENCAPFIMQNVQLGYAYLPSVQKAPPAVAQGAGDGGDDDDSQQ